MGHLIQILIAVDIYVTTDLVPGTLQFICIFSYWDLNNEERYFPTVHPQKSGAFYVPQRLRKYGKSQEMTM